MAEKLGLRNEVRELKIGQSFTDPKHTAFHTVKYDFKPASVDTNKKAAVDVAGNNQVTVTVPHLDGAGVPQTVFKGSQRPYQKECVLIIDKVTGEITLEKLSCNIQVKKTRSEFNKLHLPNADRLSQNNPDKSTTGSASSSSLSRSQTPPAVTVAQRVSHKTKVTTSGRQRRPVSATPQQTQQHNLVPKHSPLHASPSYHPSPMHTKSPKRETQSVNSGLSESHNQSTLASLPMIGVDDYSDMNLTPSTQSSQSSNNHYNNSQSSQMSQYTNNSHHHKSNNDHNSFHNNHHQLSDNENGIGEITDSSSSSSDSDSDSEDNTPATNNTTVSTNKNVNANKMTNGYTNGNTNLSSMKIDTRIYDDLCLSESESDSD